MNHDCLYDSQRTEMAKKCIGRRTFDLLIQNMQQKISVKGQHHDFSLKIAAILENSGHFYIESTLTRLHSKNLDNPQFF